MRLFFHKISLIFSGLLSVLLLSCSATPVVDTIDNNFINDNTEIKEKVITEKENIKSDQEELQNKEIETKEVVEDNNKSMTSNTSIPNNTNKEINSNTQSDTTSTTSNTKNIEVHEEVPIQENKVVNQYVGVPNPNDFYYSYHLGHIDRNYHNLDECYIKASEVALLDTIDINNTTCYEVLDGKGTILGIYMGVNCNSGNCSKYKEMVGIITD